MKSIYFNILNEAIMQDLEAARVTNGQKMLIPSSPREVCEGIGLHWWAALKLWDDKSLSFDPASTPRLDEDQESELVFLGSLVSAGCDPTFLKHLLEGLQRPYCYRISQIYFDWSARQWRPLPKSETSQKREEIFSSWVEELKDEQELNVLTQLASDIDAAIRACSIPDTSAQ